MRDRAPAPSSKAPRRSPDDLRKDVAADLARMYGTGLETSFEENPALIGGMRIQVGSDVYDGSVRGQARVDRRRPV